MDPLIGPGSRLLCVHGHFYQPPRENPFSGEVPPEPGAEPYHDFNEKIAAECYRPNAVLGNFARMSFDLGPTLASWLERHDRATYRRILAQERLHYQRHGCSNALAQVFSHAIMPLASEREKRIQVSWGLADYYARFGHRAPGIWLAETAADTATLAVLADYGVGFTVLAPWQAAEPIDPTEPYLVSLPDGRSMTTFFYCGEISGSVSFDPDLTMNADDFSARVLPRYLNPEKQARGEPQIVVVATDGELYGHHQPLRQYFLSHLLRVAAPTQGFEVTSLACYLKHHPPKREVRLAEPGSWSCHHGVERWSAGCGCTEGEGDWKGHLQRALQRLAERLDGLYEAEASELLQDPWEAEEEYIKVPLGVTTQAKFWQRYGRRPLLGDRRRRALALLEGQYYRHLMLTSCALFFEDLDRLEPRKAIMLGLRAMQAAPEESRGDLEAAFAADLKLARSWRSGRTGADLLRELSRPAARGSAARRRPSRAI